jgi:hypothetical protein
MPSKRRKGECDPPPFAKRATVVGTNLRIALDNGTIAVCPLDPFPGLVLAPKRARHHVNVIRPGIGLRWPDLGYELGVEGLLRSCKIIKPRRR